MRSFLTALLLLTATLGHAAAGDFIKATVNGKPYELKDNDLAVYHSPGGTAYARHQSYNITVSDAYSASGTLRIVMAFYLPVGAPLKLGTYPAPALADAFAAEPPYVHVHMEEGGLMHYTNWSLDEPTEGEVIITSVKGKVVEGTFRARLHAMDQETTWEVTNGTFRFTME